MKLQQRTIIITGGTSGIGLALITELAPVCKRLVVIGRNHQALAKLAAQFNNLSTYCCDLAVPQALATTARQIAMQHSDASILINNAGIQFSSERWLENFCLETAATEVNTNFIAPVVLSACFAKAFVTQRTTCAIVNISSALALAPKRDAPIYCATKAALSSFSQSLRYQLIGTTVFVSDVILPLVDTPMTLGRGTRKLSPAAAVKAIIKGVTQQRPVIYVGKARYLPWLIRLSPRLVAYILRGGH